MLATKEKSHLGFQLPTAALHPAFGFAISNTATSFHASVYDFCGGPLSSGYFRDAETGLDYAKNRYEQPGMGRFLSPDPYMAKAGGAQDPANPVSWNQYAYVGGDPVNRVDPTGQLFQGTNGCASDFCVDGYGSAPVCTIDELGTGDCLNNHILDPAFQGQLGGGGGGGSTSLPFSQLLSAQYTLRNTTFSQDCLDFLADLGESKYGDNTVNSSNLTSTIASLTFVDGTDSTALMSSLFQNTSDYQAAQQKYGNQTIGQGIQKGWALTQYLGSTVYYNPSRFLANNPSSSSVMELVLHEALHALGFTEGQEDAIAPAGSSFDATMRQKCIN